MDGGSVAGGSSMNSDDFVRDSLIRGSTRVVDRNLYTMSGGDPNAPGEVPLEFWFVRTPEEVEQLKRVAPSAGYEAETIQGPNEHSHWFLIGLKKTEVAA